MSVLKKILQIFKSSAPVEENDLVVFLVGPSGAGKTWLIQALQKDSRVQFAKNGRKLNGLRPDTREVQAWKCTFDGGPDNIVLVDTPSYHTGDRGFDAEAVTSDWVQTKFPANCNRSGIVYLHNLARDPKDVDMVVQTHVDSFTRTFPSGYKVPACIRVLPTVDSACKLPPQKVKERFARLTDQATSLRSSHIRQHSVHPTVFGGEPEMAWKVVQTLLNDISKS